MPPVEPRFQQAARLLSLLDQELREDVLSRLDQPVASRLQELLTASATNTPQLTNLEKLLERFESLWRIARKFRPSSLKLHQPAVPEEEEDEPASLVQLSTDPLKDLQRINIHQLAAAFSDEHPRSCALLMKQMSAQRNAELLALLEDSNREAIIHELSRDPTAAPTILQQLAKAILERALTFPTKPVPRKSPVERLVEVLRITDRTARRQILETLHRQAPDLAAAVRRELFQFEDLQHLDDRTVQGLLARIDKTVLCKALFGSSSEIREKVLGNLSKRAKASLEEELACQQRLPAREVQAARAEIAAEIASLEQEESA